MKRYERRTLCAALVAVVLCGVAHGQGTVLSAQKISQNMGGFGGSLDDFGNFGVGLAAIGDLDGDGVGDLIVGERGRDDGGLDRGAVWSVFLEPNGSVCIGPTATLPNCWEIISETHGGFTGSLADGDAWGAAVEPLWDLNGDGCPDVAVGAEVDDAAGTNAGALWLLFLDSSGNSAGIPGHLPAPVPAIKITTGLANFTGSLDADDRFGSSIANLGDLDGNGTVDLAVGAYRDDDGGPMNSNRGAVWILFLEQVGGTHRVLSHQKISSTSGNFTGVLDANDQFGVALAPLGDLDGDGVMDLAVGANFDDDGNTDAGAVWILFLNANGTVSSHAKISATTGGLTGGLPANELFGIALAAVPDLDGDGHVELAVGSNSAEGGPNTGAVRILFLDQTGSVHGQQKIGALAGGLQGLLMGGTEFGRSVECLGDTDGDGHPSLAVGAQHDADGGMTSASQPGAFWVLELESLPPYPGSGGDLTLATGVAGQPATPSPTVKTAPPGSVLTVQLDSPLGTHDFFAYLLIGQLFPTAGPPPAFPGVPILHVSVPGAFVIDPAPTVLTQVLPVGGKSYAFPIPAAGLGGQSLMLQGLVFPVATAPFIVATDGHEIRF